MAPALASVSERVLPQHFPIETAAQHEIRVAAVPCARDHIDIARELKMRFIGEPAIRGLFGGLRSQDDLQHSGASQHSQIRKERQGSITRQQAQHAGFRAHEPMAVEVDSKRHRDGQSRDQQEELPWLQPDRQSVPPFPQPVTQC